MHLVSNPMSDYIVYQSIGTIHSPLKTVEGMPIQPCGAAGVQGSIEVDETYLAGLRGLSGFSHAILVYHLHLVTGYALEVVPFLDTRRHGVFATRAPKRPNPIGISVVKILRIRGTSMFVDHLDIVDGTPLLDIKPYVSTFDAVEDEKIGWYEDRIGMAGTVRSDVRFM